MFFRAMARSMNAKTAKLAKIYSSLRALCGLCVLVTLTGCAARHARTKGEAAVPLEAFIEKVRELSIEARPARQNDAPTIERTDRALIAAQVALQAAPTAENHRLVAATYVRLHVFDAAYDHFAAALRLDPHDSASLDGLARIWRDWGFPDRGLGMAYRAIGFAPAAPAPRNTLGTLLVDLGQPVAARTAFERALTLDPGAAYVLNNLCYTAVLEGDAGRAVTRCQAALDADPQLVAARNNLALAYASAGDFAAASREFQLSGDAVAERFNLGVALFATRHYLEAAAAFDEAAALRPTMTVARQRAQQARDLAAGTLPE
jgi:Flp pilus assembly protein TadD